MCLARMTTTCNRGVTEDNAIADIWCDNYEGLLNSRANSNERVTSIRKFIYMAESKQANIKFSEDLQYGISQT